jgi:vacuolar-type H+-ATPase subunit E/Vma4
VQEALPYLDGKDVVVRCGASLADAVHAALQRDGRTIAIEIDESQGVGVMIAAADGSVVIDNTLPGRLARLRPRLATEITSRLAALASGDGAGHAGLE